MLPAQGYGQKMRPRLGLAINVMGFGGTEHPKFVTTDYTSILANKIHPPLFFPVRGASLHGSSTVQKYRNSNNNNLFIVFIPLYRPIPYMVSTPYKPYKIKTLYGIYSIWSEYPTDSNIKPLLTVSCQDFFQSFGRAVRLPLTTIRSLRFSECSICATQPTEPKPIAVAISRCVGAQ